MDADIRDQSAEAVGNVGRVCGVWHVVATEALQATASARSDGRILFAPGPLLRAVIEHVARIGWVLDGSTPQARAARAWLAEVVANGEDAHTHRNAGSSTRALAGAPQRLENLCEVVLPRLFDDARPDRTKKVPAQWTFLGQTWGSNTVAVEEYFSSHVRPRWGSGMNGRLEYRLASMFAHPSTTATFAQADLDTPGIADFVWDWPLTRKRTLVALAAFESATHSLYDYMGWTPGAFAAWTEHLRRFVADTDG